MDYLDLTLDTPEANLSCDLELLEACGSRGTEVLRVWESTVPFVVVGRSNASFEGVRTEVCRKLGIPVLRRSSGGGSVIQGPGSLNYAVILRRALTGPTATLGGTNRFIMDRHRTMLEALLGVPITVEGHTDLAVGRRKCSGNAQYRPREGILFHGTFLLSIDLGLTEAVLEVPSVAPLYRMGRSHRDFMTNLNISREALKAALRETWSASDPYAGRREELRAMLSPKPVPDPGSEIDG